MERLELDTIWPYPFAQVTGLTDQEEMLIEHFSWHNSALIAIYQAHACCQTPGQHQIDIPFLTKKARKATIATLKQLQHLLPNTVTINIPGNDDFQLTGSSGTYCQLAFSRWQAILNEIPLVVAGLDYDGTADVCSKPGYRRQYFKMCRRLRTIARNNLSLLVSFSNRQSGDIDVHNALQHETGLWTHNIDILGDKLDITVLPATLEVRERRVDDVFGEMLFGEEGSRAGNKALIALHLAWLIKRQYPHCKRVELDLYEDQLQILRNTRQTIADHLHLFPDSIRFEFIHVSPKRRWDKLIRIGEALTGTSKAPDINIRDTLHKLHRSWRHMLKLHRGGLWAVRRRRPEAEANAPTNCGCRCTIM